MSQGGDNEERDGNDESSLVPVAAAWLAWSGIVAVGLYVTGRRQRLARNALVGGAAIEATLAVAQWMFGEGVVPKVLWRIGGKMDDEQIDRVFGPLKLGVNYAEGEEGRIVVDPKWVADRIVKVKLFDGKVVRMHKLAATSFAVAYEAAVKASGYHPKSVQTFVPRHIRWDRDRELSLHSYGIAVDFDPTLNPWGKKKGVIDGKPEFVREFQKRGWVWGGGWKPKYRDSMHFQMTGVQPASPSPSGSV